MNQRIMSKLSKFGEVQVFKEGLVFTLLITGTGLAKTEVFMEIHKITESVKKKYKNIEVLKNDDHFYLMILKPI